MSEEVVKSILTRLESITNHSEKAIKIKDEANQFFKGI